ncbi:MAG: serpin family protein [Hormoscilla sp. GM102CHS1]|nr:serpin family protein [Hormoscilla sp. GM102CHS1]
MNIKNVKLGRAIACVILVLSLWGCVKIVDVDRSNAKVDWTHIRKQKQAAEMREQKLIEANTIFGFKLFQEILQTEGERQNIFVSPTSVAIALSMLSNGAEGTTSEAMAKTLEIQGIGEINRGYGALKASLENPEPDVQITIANSLWARQGVPFKAEFIQKTKQLYGAKVTDLDFGDKDAAKVINRWVENNTQGKIKQIVEEVKPDDVLFLINAIYFKGRWENEFDQSQTVPQPFYLGDGSQKSHPRMSQTDEYRYYETEEFQAVSLPYSQRRLSLYVFLPRKQSNLKAFYQQLNAQNWEKWIVKFSKRDGTIELPRFKIEYDIELDRVLKALGMSVAFDPRKANFSGMSEIKTNIDRVKHKTFVGVNEAGTEAAAATSIGIAATSAQIPLERSFQMIVDRPFFCAIRDNQTGSILFMGSIVDPK